MIDSHSPIGFSRMAQIVQCPGSVKMQARYPEADGPEAMGGTAAHWVFERQFCVWPESDVAIGEIAPNGVVVDAEMHAGASMMTEHVLELADESFVEVRLDAPMIHAQCFGTPDAVTWLIPKTRNRLAVSEFKYGHDFVEVYKNWQLLAQAVACGPAPTTIIDLYVVQPRSYHRDGFIRKWTITGAELEPYREIMALSCAQALSDTPPIRTGQECKNCAARHACVAFQSNALCAVDMAGEAIALDLPTYAAANEKRRLDYAIKVLEARSSGLEAQLIVAAQRGESVPHFHIGYGSGREYWTKPPEEIIAYGELMGVDVAKPREAITPRQAREAGLPALNGWSKQDSGAARLVADDPLVAQKIFGAR